MRQLLIFSALAFTVSVNGQSAYQSDSLAMTKRLKEYLAISASYDFAGVVEYTYPKLFELVPREQMIELLKSTYDNPTMKISMDSLQVQKIHPLFKYQAGLYAKVDYYMVMGMQFRDTTMNDDALEGALAALQSQYGAEKVRLNKAQKRIDISVLTGMAALKDQPADQWTFINIQKDDPLLSTLLDAALVQQLESYK
ncbi:MAG TPA: hypothetical protein VIK80_10700 [Flavihumibacter sp.]|jgi:hypothetical protein